MRATLLAMASTTEPIKAISAPPTSFPPIAKGILGPDGFVRTISLQLKDQGCYE